MQQVFTAHSNDELQHARDLLAERGIEATIGDGGNAALCLLVSDDDSAAARDVLRQLADASASNVDSHGEQVAPVPSTSPEVDSDDDEDLQPDPPPPAEPVDTTSRWRMWIGVLAVMALMSPYYSPLSVLFHAISPPIGERTLVSDALWSIAFQCVGILSMFAIIAWDGAPWGVFGLKKPSWSVDTVTGCITWVVHTYAAWIGTEVFIGFLVSCNYHSPKATLRPLPQASPHDLLGAALLLLCAISVGFCEELATRGYLIPRLERLLNSKLLAVLLSSMYFGLMHLSHGIVSVWAAFLAGLIYASVFVATRRLWPGVFAHAMFDFAIFLRRVP